MDIIGFTVISNMSVSFLNASRMSFSLYYLQNVGEVYFLPFECPFSLPINHTCNFLDRCTHIHSSINYDSEKLIIGHYQLKNHKLPSL